MVSRRYEIGYGDFSYIYVTLDCMYNTNNIQEVSTNPQTDKMISHGIRELASALNLPHKSTGILTSAEE